MKISGSYKGGRLTLNFTGELDHHAARDAMKRLSQKLDAYPPRSCVLDLKGLEFMDSSGVALFVLPIDPTLEELGDLKTAVSEAVTNCIVHAYPGKVGRICMKCRVLDDNVAEIYIKDWGCGIEDVDKAREPLYTPCGRPRGACFMRAFMVK